MNLKNKSIGTSYAKIILFGEHSVVYQKPAIALPIYSVKMTAKIIPTDFGQKIDSRYFTGNVADLSNNLIGIKTLIQKILNYFEQPELTFNLKIDSEIPSERGMGSSAATAVSITKAFFEFFDTFLTREELLKFAEVEEVITHGNPSGIDMATSSSTQPIWFIKNSVNDQIPFNLESYHLVIADSGIKGKTKMAVDLVYNNLINDPIQIQNVIDDLGDITYNAKDALANNDGERIGYLMNQAQTNLIKLGVSNDKLNEMCKTAITHKALGAKLTGSGLGGCIIALAKTKTDAEIIALNLEKIGATKTWIQSFEKYNRSGES